MTITILWLSQRLMTPQELESLKSSPAFAGDDTEDLAALEVVTDNMSFPLNGPEAAKKIIDKALEVNATFIAGTLPAHIAMSLRGYIRGNNYVFPDGLFIPVNKQLPSDEDKKNTEHVHDHWELFTGEEERVVLV